MNRDHLLSRAAHVALTRYGLVLAWIGLIVIFGILSPSTFLTAANLQTILGSQAILLILTLCLLLPLAAGELDLSIAGTLSISVVLIGWLNVNHGWPIIPVILIVLLAGVVIGAVHSFLIVVLRLDSIVITLGTGTLLAGLGFAIEELAVGGVSPALVSVVRDQVLGIPLAFFYALGLTVIVWYVFTYTPFGRYLFFVGTSRDVARLSGVRVDLIRTASLMTSSIGAAVAGIVLAGTLGASDPTAGANYLLPVFAGAFLGATAVRPGRFNAWGTFVAVYFLATGITGLQLEGLSGWIEQVFYGGSLVIAVTLSALIARARVNAAARPEHLRIDPVITPAAGRLADGGATNTSAEADEISQPGR